MSEKAKIRAYIEQHCGVCIVQACYRIIGALQEMRVYDEAIAQHNRNIFVEMTERFDDGFAFRNKITEFWWGLPDNFQKLIHQHAMLKTMEVTLRASATICRSGVHASTDTTIWLDERFANNGALILKGRQ